MYNPKQIRVLVVGLILNACATTPQLTQQEINQQYPSLVELGERLDKARNNQVDLLSPQSFKQAVAKYDSAKATASLKQDDETNKAVAAGNKALQKAQENANTGNNIFAEVIKARQKALQAGAEKMLDKQFNSLDTQFSEASNLLEQGEIEQAKKRRPELQRNYSNLELLALKQSTTMDARAALALAKENDADKLAPKTFAQAQEELRLSESILEIDRTDVTKANSHATRATILSNRSINIAEVVKDFSRRDFSNEDIVLWHQNELASISTPLGEKLTFDEPNDVTVNSIQQKIGEVVAAKNDSQQKASALENKLAQLEATNQQNIAQLNKQHMDELARLNSQFSTEMAKQEVSRAEMAALEVARESRFDRIQNMFNDNEAKVYRQKNNVLLSVYGIDFPPGNADIKPNNFALMEKIVKSISEFDGAKVVVSGHTDITGSAELNKTLSEQRAQNVAKFLYEVGGIAKDHVAFEGYGQIKPVASNETPEGRALNRRVEILIVNK